MSEFFYCDDPGRRSDKTRGQYHTQGGLGSLLEIWDRAQFVQHDRDGSELQFAGSGEPFFVSDHFAFASSNPDGQWFRGAMRHATWFWGRTAAIANNPLISREFRLEARAFGQVYDVLIFDNNDQHKPLTGDDHRRLIHMRREIRRTWHDARTNLTRDDFGQSNWEKASRNEQRYGRIRELRARLNAARAG